MRFRNLFEDDDGADGWGVRTRDFHDKGVHDLTHEVLTGIGMRHRVDSSGQHSYDSREVGHTGPHVDVDTHVRGMGWERRVRDDRDENYDDGKYSTRVYQHPRHQRYLVHQHSGYVYGDYEDDGPSSHHLVTFGGLRSRPDAP